MLNSKPNPEVGLRILESVTNVSQPNQGVQLNKLSQDNPRNSQDEKQQS